MKVAVCVIGRKENAYIEEFVKHYLSMGVDKIIINDNNYDGEEKFEDVLSTYIIDGFVEIIDFRNRRVCQLESYQNCWNKYNNDYDWMLFFDCDEFLYVNNNENNIKEYLSQPKFNNFDMIHINWMNYGDNNLVRYEDKPLVERFHTPILPIDFKKSYNFPEANHVKSIIRCGINGVSWVDTPHTPRGVFKCCNSVGEYCDGHSPFVNFNFLGAHIKHYTTKTIEEWLNVKVYRGFPDGNADYFKNNDPIKSFFNVNEITDEKLSFLKEKGFNVDYLQ